MRKHLPKPTALLAQVPLPMAFSAVEEIANKPNHRQRNTAVWTMAGTWMMIILFAATTGGYADLWHLFGELFDGDTSRAELHSGETMRMAPAIAAAVSVNLLAVIPFGVLANRAVKLEREEHSVSNMFEAKQPTHQYLVIMLTLLCEELYARWLHLGELTKFELLSGVWGFYLLFFVGNLTWSWIHLGNIKKRNITLSWQQKILFVTPQFVCGLFFTAIYVPYGLFGALIAHVAYDMVLFANSRVDVFNLGEKVLTLYHFVIGSAAALYFFAIGNESLLDMKFWLTDGLTEFALPGWTFWEYASAVIMLFCYGKVVLELLLFDHHCATTWVELFRDWLHFGFYLGFSFVAVLGLLGPEPWRSLPVLVVSLSLIAAFTAKSSSGSGVARVFWEALLLNSLVVCAVIALVDPRQILLFIGIMLAIQLPDHIMRYLDKDTCGEPDCCAAKEPHDIKSASRPTATAAIR